MSETGHVDPARGFMGTPDQDLDDRVGARIAELRTKARLTKAELQELDILTYPGPVPRVIPRSDEVPY